MIYLDSAATSLYKPESVQLAVIRAMNRFASPGRGTHAAAMAAADCCYLCRERLARLFHVPSPEQVVFTFNATHGLNIALNSLAGKGSRVMISGWEHNAVTRPLHAMGAEILVASGPLFSPGAFLERAEALLKRADLVVCTHVSNVFGYILPLCELSALCRRYGKPMIVDASQSAGTLDLDFSELGAAFIAMPGHKGLLGPQGTGVLLCNDDTKPLLHGGSGSESVRQVMPDYLPDRLEAGTHNVTGIAGLSAGIEFLLEHGTSSVREKESVLLSRLADSLSGVDGLRRFYSGDRKTQCGVLSVLPEQMTCDALGEALGNAGIAVRTGLHCAPLAHETEDTLNSGTVRFSFSPFNTPEQIDAAAEKCRSILEQHDANCSEQP